MAEFRPRVAAPADPPPSRAHRLLWIAAPLATLAAVGLLVVTGEDLPDAPDPAARSAATRSASGGVSAGDSPLAALPPPDPYRPDPAGAALLRELKLEPRRAAGGATGYVVTPADAELLAATPLREGDVLLEIDGQKLDPARIATLADELGEYDDVWVSFERDGRKQGVLVELRRR
jgi:hypothetical protein